MNAINTNFPVNNKFIPKNSNDFKNSANPLDLQKNFLSLLIAQIKNQDPTDPIKNTELTSQLAQINTASGIERLNNTVVGFAYQIHQNQNVQASSLIGHHVMIPNSKFVHTKNTETRFGIELIGNATSVEIKITNKDNKTVHVEKLKDAKPGIYHFTWNGKDLNDKNTITEKYNIVVTAKNNEKDVPVQGLSEELVNSVITSSSDPVIDLGAAGNITLLNVCEILN